MLQFLSVSDLEDSVEHNMCHTQAMWAQIAAKISKLQEKPTQADQAAGLQVKDQ